MECVVCYENECRCVPKSIIGEHYGIDIANGPDKTVEVNYVNGQIDSFYEYNRQDVKFTSDFHKALPKVRPDIDIKVENET